MVFASIQSAGYELLGVVRNAKLSATVLMLVIHAGFRERCLVLWGESSIGDRVPAEPGVHPFSASYEQLADALESISVKVPRVEAVSDEVLLPSFDRMPVPSSPLLGREAQGKKAIGSSTLAGGNALPPGRGGLGVSLPCYGKRNASTRRNGRRRSCVLGGSNAICGGTGSEATVPAGSGAGGRAVLRTLARGLCGAR